MAAPSENTYWRNRSRHGRSRHFATVEHFQQAWFDYFEWCDANPWYRNEAIKSGPSAGTIIPVPVQRPYTEKGFTCYHGLGQGYLRDLAKAVDGKEDPDSQGFWRVLSWARSVCFTNKFEGAAIGVFDANIIARTEGLADRSQIELPRVNIEGASEDNQQLLEEVIRKLNGSHHEAENNEKSKI